MTKEILTVDNIKVQYNWQKSGFSLVPNKINALNGVSLSVKENRSFGIVGESGCGKSTLGKAIVKLVKPCKGDILFNGRSIGLNKKRASNEIKIQMIFQTSHELFDPRTTVGKSVMEPFIIHNLGAKEEREFMALKLLEDVGLPDEVFDKFPHELSGGQKQRVNIARMLALNPSIVICDEPVSALDVSVQAQMLNLMRDLQKKYRITYIFISHNLSVVKHMCEEIAVMYLGTIVETGPKSRIFNNPLHPYTKALLDAIPSAEPNDLYFQQALKGETPSLLTPPRGCPFHTRCRYAKDVCKIVRPVLTEVSEGHQASCFMAQGLLYSK